MPPRALPILWLLLAAFVVTPATAAAAEVPAPATPPTTFLPDRVIVEWAPGTVREERAEAREGAAVSYRSSLGDPTFQLVDVEPGQAIVAAVSELRANPAVAAAERDGLRALNSIPDDPLFGQLWGLQNSGAGIGGFSGATPGADIDAPGAWDRTVGTPSTVVADIDSGYRFGDPDLGPVAWENPGEIAENGLDDDGNGYVDDVHGYDFVGPSSDSPGEDSDPTDDNLVSGGHGLHTAGTIGAAGNNGVGITGVAQDVRLLPLRVCANSVVNGNEGRCPISSIVAAINYAGANGARVANISLGGTSFSAVERDAFASNPQTLYVVSAGNDAQNNDFSPHYPCDYEPEGSGIGGAIENIVCVAATDQADALASFSDWGGSTVDLGAPGTEILSTYPAEEDRLGEGFEGGDFESKWSATGPDGGFAATSEAPLASTGMSDSPGAAPATGSVRESILTTGFSVPAGYGGCQFSGRRFVSLGGGILTQTVFSDGEPVFQSKPPSTAGTAMVGFATVPITELAGSSVKIRFRYEAGGAPTAFDGVWLDDLKLTCRKPVDAPLTYRYLQGTSMAAPHVTGAAALLFSIKPTATVAQARQALLGSVDPDPALAGKTVSGGRLDAAQAIGMLADPPPPPQLTSTDPDSPANWNDPRIVGSAEAGSSIRIFGGTSCAGSPVATGTADELEAPGIAVEVLDDSTSQFSATATDALANESSCSAPISFTERSTVPTPSLTSTDPASPANENQPKIVGSVETGSTVDVYAGAACEGTPIASGTAAELASPGIAVSVADDSVNQFSATAAESGLFTSFCSTPISYTNSTVPTTPTLPGFSTVIVVIPDEPLTLPPAPPLASCKVPKLAGKTLAQAKAALGGAGCRVGKVVKPKARKGQKPPALVVKSSVPGAGSTAAGAVVSLTLGPKPKTHHH
jgi:hypothetical protein